MINRRKFIAPDIIRERLKKVDTNIGSLLFEPNLTSIPITNSFDHKNDGSLTDPKYLMKKLENILNELRSVNFSNDPGK